MKLRSVRRARPAGGFWLLFSGLRIGMPRNLLGLVAASSSTPWDAKEYGQAEVTFHCQRD
jgi:hypothetical protein